MTVSLSTIIETLRPYIGEFTSDFVALQLSKVDTAHVRTEQHLGGRHIALPESDPRLDEEELAAFFSYLRQTLNVMIGPHHTHRLIHTLQHRLELPQ